MIMKNKKLTILIAEFTGVDIHESSVDESHFILGTDKYEEYSPFTNPAQMDDFIEHPDVMMNVWCVKETWIANSKKEPDVVKANNRPTAINKCAAAFFGETYEE